MVQCCFSRRVHLDLAEIESGGGITKHCLFGLRCRSVPLRQSLWCRSVPTSAATFSRFRHVTAPNGTQRHLSAPKTFFPSAPGSYQLSWNGFTISIPCASGKNPARSGPPIADRCPQTATRHSSSCPNPQLDIARHSSRSDQLKYRVMSSYVEPC